jgi:TetR/AcrR family transcriptional repressor of mexJK operon
VASSRRTAAGRPTQAALEQRKARTLRTAEKLFMTRGYAATSVNEIAKQARVSPRMIKAHFGGKDDIFIQIIKDRSLRASVPALDVQGGGTLEDILIQVARAMWNVSYSPGAIQFLRIVVAEGERFKTHTSEIARSTNVHFRKDVETLFADLHRNGMIDAPDAATTTKYFVDLIVGYSMPQAAMGYWDRVPDENEMCEKVQLFCHAVAAAPGGDARSRAAAG